MKTLTTLVALLALCRATLPAAAEELRCSFDNISDLYIRLADDGTVRVGLAPGVGHLAAVSETEEGFVVIEHDGSGLPITFTTILPDNTAVHSRHVVDGGILPSQGRGTCETMASTRPAAID